jgi:two-component system, NtrC family, sensor kinase
VEIRGVSSQQSAVSKQESSQRGTPRDPGSGILDPGLARISVSDNGSGIPAAIRDKIFQPFFTTKPTGQGTGLGLSLSYDIIKAHGGELNVGSVEGKGAEFVVVLPGS